jgi:hypothetical protein
MRNFCFIHASEGKTGNTGGGMRALSINRRFFMTNREKIVLANRDTGPTISANTNRKGVLMKLRLTNLLDSGRGILLALVLSGATAAATDINFDIGASTGVKTAVSAPFAALSGTSLQGQTLSINLVFGPGQFGRLFTVSDSSLTAGLTLNTNAAGLAGFLDGTGYLFDQQMNPLEAPQQLGSASNGSGLMFASLFPLQSSGLTPPLDFFGIHFDLTLPNNPSISISANSSFDLFFSDNNPSARFGIGPGIPQNIVPETGNCIYLFGLALTGLFAARSKFAAA